MSRPSLVRGHNKYPTEYVWPPNTDNPTHRLPAWSTVAARTICMDGPRQWATGDYVRDNITYLATLKPDDIRRTVANATRDPDHDWVIKRDRGSDVHRILNGEPPQRFTAAELEPWVQAARDFWANHVDHPLYQEHTIYNPTAGYAGTVDLICRLKDGRNSVVDWKTGVIRPSNAYQLVAYANGEFIGTPDGQVHEMPAIHIGLIVQLEPNRYTVHPVQFLDGPYYEEVVRMAASAAHRAFAEKSAIGTPWPQ